MHPAYGQQVWDVFDYPGLVSTADIAHAQLCDFDWWSDEAAQSGGGLPASNMIFPAAQMLAGPPFSTVPEPSTMALMGIGLAGVGLMARRSTR